MNNADDIKLNMEALSENDITYTSITDLYDVHIFTDSDMKEFETRVRREDLYYDEINQKVFIVKQPEQAEGIQDLLFLSESSSSKKQEFSDDSPELNRGTLFIGILILCIFILCMVRYNIYRAIRRKRNANSSDIYQWGK